MSNRRIILFLLCCIAFCAVLLLGLQQRRPLFPLEEKTKTSLIDAALDTVTRVAIDRGDARIVLNRAAGKWTMTAPFPAQVEQGAVARLLDAFETAHVKDALAFQEIRKRELSLGEFGLSPARMQVLLESPQRRDLFLFGAYTPPGTEVYLRMGGNDPVLVVPAALCDAVPKTADDLRSRKLMHGPRGAARTLEVRSPGNPFITLSRDTGTWRLVQPVAAPASDEKVEALLDVLYAARVSRFVWPTVSNVMDVAEAESAVKTRMGLYGLGPDTGLQISVQEAGAAQPARLTLGHPLDGAGALSYVLLPDGEAIGAVSNAVSDAFRLSVTGLRDPRPFSGSATGVRRLQIHMGDVQCVLTQTNAVWRFEVPIADEAEQAAVWDTLEKLLRLKAESLEDAAAEQRERDLEQNTPVSHVELGSDQDTWRFTIQAGDVAGHYMNLRFANAPTVFRVASSNVPPALTGLGGLLGLRDKTMLALPRASLRRITVKRNGEPSPAVERDSGDAAWHLGEGHAGRISAERLDTLVKALETLRADRIEGVGLSPEQLAEQGLLNPWLELSVDVEAKDAVRKVLLVGKEAGFGKRYAAVRGLDVLFVLAPETLATLSARFVDPIE
jgi:hypothetical protein